MTKVKQRRHDVYNFLQRRPGRTLLDGVLLMEAQMDDPRIAVLLGRLRPWRTNRSSGSARR
ncbi:hypothetical protein [Nonomuraea jabiensis]|uniref:hypothetical protein n=1 Tax=Nonomuraea jabiensis TaxID=882448 RepID=UPI003D70C758